MKPAPTAPLLSSPPDCSPHSPVLTANLFSISDSSCSVVAAEIITTTTTTVNGLFSSLFCCISRLGFVVPDCECD